MIGKQLHDVGEGCIDDLERFEHGDASAEAFRRGQ